MTTTLSTKGQIVLPAAARRRLGLLPGAALTCTVRDGEIILVPEASPTRRPRLVKSKCTGLVYAEATDAPPVTSEQVHKLLADFP